MEDASVARCDRCGRRLSGDIPESLVGTSSSTLCVGCAHPAYRAGSDTP